MSDTFINGQMLSKCLATLARDYRLVAIYAFGSRAKEAFARLRGELAESEFPASDLDVGVLPARDYRLSWHAKVTLAIALEDLFNVPRVDLVVLPEAPPFLALDVVRGELLYTSDPDAEAEYQLYVLRRAGDLAPWERERRRMILEGEAI